MHVHVCVRRVLVLSIHYNYYVTNTESIKPFIDSLAHVYMYVCVHTFSLVIPLLQSSATSEEIAKQLETLRLVAQPCTCRINTLLAQVIIIVLK